MPLEQVKVHILNIPDDYKLSKVDDTKDASVHSLGPIPSSDVCVCTPTIIPKFDVASLDDITRFDTKYGLSALDMRPARCHPLSAKSSSSFTTVSVTPQVVIHHRQILSTWASTCVGSHPGVPNDDLRLAPINLEHRKWFKNQIGQRCQAFVRCTFPANLYSIAMHNVWHPVSTPALPTSVGGLITTSRSAQKPRNRR
ncbi:hypothetical protein BCR44DRAFT_1449596 [Catenaria anguillulae PL171]|uniref:Uncharacterized protein n=1 Tax=Catenaria anguillulae PL171 TaxID=765915 RepID=A0A1Y2H4M5_9FUNG|nr:hypothetical protein BCR44DRAFT_1449596 [Catenaria anguillulae PL171]